MPPSVAGAKRLYLVGALPSFDRQRITDPIERFAATGRNTGNQVIAYGLLKTLCFDAASWSDGRTPEQVGEEFDAVVIPAANFLFPKFDFSSVAEFVERTRLPCVMVGVGAQSNSYDADIPLKPGTRRLMHVVAERSALIGARGPFTAEVLARLGIKNVQVTGCPSYYMRARPELAIAKPPLPRAPRLAASFSRDVIQHSFNPEMTRAAILALAREAIARDATYVIQTELPELKLAELAGTPAAEEALKEAMRFFRDTGDPRAARKWLQRRVRAYWDVKAWIDDMGRHDFSFGLRFHGNMAAIQAGRPALFITHDSRTAEMCGFLGLPHVRVDEITDFSTEALYDLVDVDRLAKRYRELYPAYRPFLDANGLTPAFH